MQYGLPLRITAILVTSFLGQHFVILTIHMPVVCTHFVTNMVVVGVEPALPVYWLSPNYTHTCAVEILLSACTHTSISTVPPCPRRPSYLFYPWNTSHHHSYTCRQSTGNYVISFSMRATQLLRVALGITHHAQSIMVPCLTKYPEAVWAPIEDNSYSGNFLPGTTLSVILTIHMPVVCTHIFTY